MAGVEATIGSSGGGVTGVVTSCLGCRTSDDGLGTGLCIAWVSVLVTVVTGDDTGSVTGSVTGLSGIPNGKDATNKHDRTSSQCKQVCTECC